MRKLIVAVLAMSVSFFSKGSADPGREIRINAGLQRELDEFVTPVFFCGIMNYDANTVTNSQLIDFGATECIYSGKAKDVPLREGEAPLRRISAKDVTAAVRKYFNKSVHHESNEDFSYADSAYTTRRQMPDGAVVMVYRVFVDKDGLLTAHTVVRDNFGDSSDLVVASLRRSSDDKRFVLLRSRRVSDFPMISSQTSISPRCRLAIPPERLDSSRTER